MTEVHHDPHRRRLAILGQQRFAVDALDMVVDLAPHSDDTDAVHHAVLD